MLRSEPFCRESFDDLCLSWVVDNRRKNSIDFNLSTALHGARNLSRNPLYSLDDLLPRWHVIRANSALHESVIREHIKRMTCNEVTNGEHEVLATVNVP